MAKEENFTSIQRFNPVYYDTYANLPTTNLRAGTLAYATDRLMLYRWSGSAWVAITFYCNSGLASAIPTASNLAEGSLYYETDTYLLKQVQSSAWVAITIYSRSGTAGSIPSASGLPEGSLYYETDTGNLKQVQSSAWVTITGSPWVSIASWEHSSDVSSFSLTFSAYDLIKVEFRLKVTTTGTCIVDLEFNNISTANYDYRYIDGTTITLAVDQTDFKLFELAITGTRQAIGELLICGKHVGVKDIRAMVTCFDEDSIMLLNGMFDGDGADLTRLDFGATAGDFVAGSWVKVYGKNA